MVRYDPLRRLLARLRGEEPPRPPPDGDRTGQTVFDDLPLRFRALTVTDADWSRLADPAGPPGAFKIRLASQGTRRAAGQLVERRYASRGYVTGEAPGDPHLFTFLAYDEGVLAGTVGVRLDSDRGLSADELYHEELAPLRADGASLCEFTRLAVDVKAASKPVLAGLFHTAYLFAARLRRHTHAVIEVNPRHVPFYRRALRFEPLGAERLNPRVDAPGILLGVSFEEISRGLARYGGRGAAAEDRSLFAYAFGPDEEPGILSRLKSLDRR
jgi:hypothetical protein